jgi:NAD(P)-dependent dehydrogenase (short-subunit alcohol dehydrogenase family)
MSISLRDGILAGRVAFVAGASSGINLGVAMSVRVNAISPGSIADTEGMHGGSSLTAESAGSFNDSARL